MNIFTAPQAGATVNLHPDDVVWVGHNSQAKSKQGRNDVIFHGKAAPSKHSTSRQLKKMFDAAEHAVPTPVPKKVAGKKGTTALGSLSPNVDNRKAEKHRQRRAKKAERTRKVIEKMEVRQIVIVEQVCKHLSGSHKSGRDVRIRKPTDGQGEVIDSNCLIYTQFALFNF